VDLTVIGACIEKWRKPKRQAAPVVGKEKSVRLEIAQEKKAVNHAVVVLPFHAIRFCKVINVCKNITRFSALTVDTVRSLEHMGIRILC